MPGGGIVHVVFSSQSSSGVPTRTPTNTPSSAICTVSTAWAASYCTCVDCMSPVCLVSARA